MEKIKNLLASKNIDALWVTNPYNKRYITGFTGSTCEVIVSKEKIYFLTDGRYAQKVKEELSDKIEIKIINSYVNYFQETISILKGFNVIAVESEDMCVRDYKNLCNTLPNVKVELLDTDVTNVRLVKTEKEIEEIKKAVEITDKTYSEFVSIIKPGMTEIQAQNLADNLHLKYGADKPSFDTILVSGKNTAFPHGKASEKILEDGDIITLDFGCYKNGYVSDMTRTFFLGKPKNSELVKIYNIVLKAHNEQIAAIKDGISTKEIDKIGRNIIANEGYGDYFVHGTGHGIGLEIHEAPYLNKTDTTILKENMVVTIEPGIYVPGLGGVRIEQDIVVKKNGCIELNKSPKNHLINQE